MIHYSDDDEIMHEVRQNKAELLKEYGGVQGLLQHMDNERPALEKQGWKFVDSKDVYSQNLQRQISVEEASHFV
jgi:hypothetical protein